MKKHSLTLMAVAVSMSVVMAAPATAASESGVDSQPLVEHYELDGSVSGQTIGRSDLIRRSDGLKASVQATSLIPGGVYTFWWVIIPTGGVFPDDTFVALGNSAIAGPNGKATVHMRAAAGQSSISGFLFAFQDLDFDLATAEVRVEIAYHGLAEDAGSDLEHWMSDFWTGAACPQAFGLNPGGTSGDLNAAGQPFCPVFIASIHN